MPEAGKKGKRIARQVKFCDKHIQFTNNCPNPLFLKENQRDALFIKFPNLY